MKNIIKSLAVVAAAVMVLGLGTQKANAANVGFSIGVNLGVPVVAAPVYAATPVYAPVYTPRPVPVYRTPYYGGYGYRPVGYGYRHDYRYDRFRHDRGWHRGWDRDDHDGWRR